MANLPKVSDDFFFHGTAARRKRREPAEGNIPSRLRFLEA
jgi:hypothetical protein